MGREVECPTFGRADFERFGAELERETALLGRMLSGGDFSEGPFVAGFELEAWLVDRNYFPAPINEAFLARLADPLVVPELSRFNVELNGTPQRLAAGALRRLENELEHTWRRCLAVSHELEAGLVMTGILPTVCDADLTLANMSPLKRYAALNEQVLAARHGKPLRVRMAREETLDTVHRDVMLEAATTSFQIHLQVPASRALRFYNASTILSAPMVAAGANSPLLFATPLWEETRIPLFEQAVEPMDAADGTVGAGRVTLGTGYAEHSMHEVFAENASVHALLLPVAFDSAPDRFSHLRLHNGTIWRWNRPLVGFDGDGRPHLRIEHRVLPAGPSIRDQIANMALYFGAVGELARRGRAPEASLPFSCARDNFYAAARDGLESRLTWLDGTRTSARDLLLDELLPLAARGLERFGLADEIDDYLGIVQARVRLRQTGAAWQRAFFHANARDVYRLTAAYLEHQRSGMPVHEWDA